MTTIKQHVATCSNDHSMLEHYSMLENTKQNETQHHWVVKRRLVALMFLACGAIEVIAVIAISPFWENAIEDTNFDDRYWPLLLGCTGAILAFYLCSFAAIILLRRWCLFFRDFSRAELMVLMKWSLKGDPLGRRLGREQCHRCGHERGASSTCPECGSDRIDPLP